MSLISRCKTCPSKCQGDTGQEFISASKKKINANCNCNIKGIVHPNLLSLLTLKLFQTCMKFFLLFNTKEDVLKNFANQIVDGPH